MLKGSGASSGTSERLQDKSGSHFSGRYDDQVDALLLFLDWFAANEDSLTVSLVGPIFISRAEVGLSPLIRDWSCHY
jgi:hypothetical protein